MPRQHTPQLGAERAIALVSDQWFVSILQALMAGPLRFSELQRRLVGISKKVLAQTLRRMEADGFLAKRSYEGALPHTEYRLTELGESLVPPLQGLCRWAEEHLPEPVALRRREAE
jgi:DNA-binding HxlR family transcriptional regulator